MDKASFLQIYCPITFHSERDVCLWVQPLSNPALIFQRSLSSVVPFALTVWIHVYFVEMWLRLNPPTRQNTSSSSTVCWSSSLWLQDRHSRRSSDRYTDIPQMFHWAWSGKEVENRNIYNCQRKHDWCRRGGSV